MKSGPFPMINTLGHIFPHMESTWRPCLISLDDYLACSPPIKFTLRTLSSNTLTD